MTNSDLFSVRWEFVKQSLAAWMTGLDQMKKKGSHQVVMASAVGFLLVCKRFDLSATRVLEVAGRMIQHKASVDPQYIRAFDQWLRGELRDV